MSARDELFDGLVGHACCFGDEDTNKLLDAYRDQVALGIGRDALKDGLAPTLTRLVGVTNAAKLMAGTVGLLGPRDEPRIHSGLTDVLPDDHPLRNRHTYCDRDKCRELLHCCINENMQTWVEAQRGNYCLPCFAKLDDEDGSDAWGVPR